MTMAMAKKVASQRFQMVLKQVFLMMKDQWRKNKNEMCRFRPCVFFVVALPGAWGSAPSD